MNSLLVLCFTISGATALALEVLWMRSAGLVLGATALTTATVLACYLPVWALALPAHDVFGGGPCGCMAYSSLVRE
jgi:hypothetical protein